MRRFRHSRTAAFSDYPIPPKKSFKKIQFAVSFKNYFIWSIVNNVVLVSGVQQSHSIIRVHVAITLEILFPLRLLQNIE